MTMQAVGGIAAMVVLWDDEADHLLIRASTNAVSYPRGSG